jgi:hypothetical protein
VIRHVSCLTWSDAATPNAVAAVVAALDALPAQIPDIRAYHVGADLGLADGNADLVIIADFDDVAAWRRYQEHPAHRAVIVEQIRPILAGRTAAQLDGAG